jgi:HSP20 family protein
MALVRWRPLTQAMERPVPSLVSDLQAEMNRLFDVVFGRSPGNGAGPASAWSPSVDIYETDDALVVACELPGVNEKEVQVSLAGDTLSIQGERRQPEAEIGTCYWSERRYGKFERCIQLPLPVRADQVKATYRHGVLTITLPKADEVKAKEIKIQAV